MKGGGAPAVILFPGQPIIFRFFLCKFFARPLFLSVHVVRLGTPFGIVLAAGAVYACRKACIGDGALFVLFLVHRCPNVVGRSIAAGGSLTAGARLFAQRGREAVALLEALGPPGPPFWEKCSAGVSLLLGV